MGSSRARSALLPLEPVAANFGGRQFALPPEMEAMHGLFAQGKAAIVGNVGPLLAPTDRAAFLSRAVVPSQGACFRTMTSSLPGCPSRPRDRNWAGVAALATAAALGGANVENVFSQISLFGNTVFLSGERVGPYQIGVDGVPSIFLLDRIGNGVPASLGPIFRDHFTSAGENRSQPV